MEDGGATSPLVAPAGEAPESSTLPPLVFLRFTMRRMIFFFLCSPLPLLFWEAEAGPPVPEAGGVTSDAGRIGVCGVVVAA